MPLLFLFGYFIAESIAFWAVANLIGLGWALVALFVTMLCGMLIAGLEVRRIMSTASVKGEDGTRYVRQDRAGRTAGNIGLTLAGGLLLSAPGFITTVLGALLIFPPTRALFRAVLTIKLIRSVENWGVRFYEASPMSSAHTQYGSFGQASTKSSSDEATPDPASQGEVIDEDEIRQWLDSAKPEDFGRASGDDKRDSGEGDSGNGKQS